MTQLRHHAIQFFASTSDSNVAEGYTVIGTGYTAVRQSRRTDGGRSGGEHGPFLQEFPPIYFELGCSHRAPPDVLMNFRVYNAHNGRTNPWVVARVLRTSNNTRIIPTNGPNPAVTTMESKECVARDCSESEKYPINLKAIIVPIPAPVPLRPLTEATDSLEYKSDGRTFAIV